MIDRLSAWTLRRLLTGESVNGEVEALAEPFRTMADHLARVATDKDARGRARREALAAARAPLWDAMRAARPDRDELVKALAETDPLGPPPEAASVRSFATLADIRRIVSDQPWLWLGWIARGVLNVVASEPGTGKTRFALDLARRLWFGLNWPDGQTNELPERTRTLWVQGDRAFPEMLLAAHAFGLPDDSVALGSSPDEPMGSLDLDDDKTLSALALRIRDASPALVVIDTVGMVTAHDLTRPEEARAFFAPVIELARETGVAFLGLTHLNRDGKALGRRIVEKARVVGMMTQPDPDGQTNRRRLWVDKSAVVKPPPLGVTMGDAGNDYDFNPPSEPEPIARRPGPAPVKTDACQRWLIDRLTSQPSRVTDVRKDADKAGYSADTLYRARDALGVEEYKVGRLLWWKLPGSAEPDPM